MSADTPVPSEGQFAVGEIAIMHGLVYMPEWNGVECEIVGGLDTYAVMLKPWSNSRTKHGYRVRVADGRTGVVEPKHLRKKRPPRKDLQVVRWDQCPWQPESISV